MKFAKTFCKPGASVSVVPAGLQIRLQYNEHGLLQKFDLGFSEDLDPMYKYPEDIQFNYNAVFNRIKGLVPQSISTTGGTTWIYGVLYSNEIPCDEGKVPEALYKGYLEALIGKESFTFYAGYVHSLAASFNGPLIVRNFLGLANFNLLPQIIVPVTMSDDTLQMLLSKTSYPYRSEFIAGFFIFEDLKCRYASANLSQICVTKDVKPYVEQDGFLKGDVIDKAGNKHTLSYSSVVRHGVSKGCTLLVEQPSPDSSFDIISTRLGKGANMVVDSLAHEVKCPVCGKMYQVGYDDAPVQCDDPHCLSHSYQDAVRMLEVFQLPALSYDKYKKAVKDKDIICLTDILELPDYKDIEIETTLANILYAAIPVTDVPDFNLLEKFVNKCNNSIETITYYLENPLRIETDLDVTDPMVKRFANWLEDPYNVTTLLTLFSRVKAKAKAKKFDGCPMFRGNTFAITGKFKRGDYPEIKSILASYAADVVPSIEPGTKFPDALIVGSLNDGVSGFMIQKARLHHVPILDEDEFFKEYAIDEDLANNLL